MSLPNLLPIVEAVYARGWDFTTKAGLCAYSNAVVSALHAEDPLFGHLVKSEAQNHCVDAQGRLHAVDVTFYYPTGQVVDFIASAGFGTPPPPNTPTWHEGPLGEYPPESWYAPGEGNGPPPDPPPDEDLAARVTELEKQMKLQAIIDKGQQDQITELAKQIADIHQLFVAKPLPTYVGRLFGFTIRSYPE